MDRRSRRSTQDRSPRIGRWAPRTFGPGLFPLTSALAAPAPHRRTAGPAGSHVHQIVRFLPTPRPPPAVRQTHGASRALNDPSGPPRPTAPTLRDDPPRPGEPDISASWRRRAASPTYEPPLGHKSSRSRLAALHRSVGPRWNSARDDRIGTTPIGGVRVKLRSRAKHGSLKGHFDPSESSTAEPSDRPSTRSPRQAAGVASLGDGAVQSFPRFCSLAGWAAGRL